MSSAIHVIFVAVVALCYVKNSQSYTYEHAYCTDLKPQNILDINQIMGVWYAVEIIPHLETQAGTIVFDSCPVIHISEGNLDVIFFKLRIFLLYQK